MAILRQDDSGESGIVGGLPPLLNGPWVAEKMIVMYSTDGEQRSIIPLKNYEYFIKNPLEHFEFDTNASDCAAGEARFLCAHPEHPQGSKSVIDLAKFNVGDKVKIIKEFWHRDIYQEYVNLKGLEGEVLSISETHYSPLYYNVDIHGAKFNFIPETSLDLIERSNINVVDMDRYSQEYEDIDGVILPDVNKPVNLIQSYKRSGEGIVNI